MPTRHPSQEKLLENLAEIEAAILSLPPDAEVHSDSLTKCDIVLDRDTFHELFRGRRIALGRDGIVAIEFEPITYIVIPTTIFGKARVYA